VEQVILSTSSSFVVVRKETDLFKTYASTPITSSFSELDQATEWASGSGMRAEELGDKEADDILSRCPYILSQHL